MQRVCLLRHPSTLWPAGTMQAVHARRTPADEWYCFEVNPSPGFTYFQAATQQPIAEAIADLLIAGAMRRAAPN